MQELTQEQAERCARACGWTFDPACTANGYYIIPFPVWVPNEKGLCAGASLSLDPYFWFPRLWERLMQGAVEGGYDIEVYVPTNHSQKDTLLITLHGDLWNGGVEKRLPQIDHPCLALCTAIESLEKEPV